MKHALRKLTAAAIAALIASAAPFATAARGQGTADKGSQDSSFSIQNSASPSRSIVADSAHRLAAEPAISAEMRYRIDAFGHELVGTGSYLQFGPGAEKLLRLDLKMQVGDKLATVQEIRSADAYWVRRDVPPTPASLGYVDLRQLRSKSAATTAPTAPPTVMPQDDWIMLGGLARLVAALDQNFTFDNPKADEIRFTASDGKSIVRLPVWTTSGTWKSERLATLTDRDPKKPSSLPEQLPDRVELVLGRTDDVLPLFPYRISYFRTPPLDNKSADKHAPPDAPPPTPRELLTLQLFNVSRKPIDPREFQYQPGDQDVKNLTPYYVQRLTGDTKLR
jgi:hypothetical protein